MVYSGFIVTVSLKLHNQKSKEKVDRTDKESAISPHCRSFSNPQAHDFFSSQHFRPFLGSYQSVRPCMIFFISDFHSFLHIISDHFVFSSIDFEPLKQSGEQLPKRIGQKRQRASGVIDKGRKFFYDTLANCNEYFFLFKRLFQDAAFSNSSSLQLPNQPIERKGETA